MLDMVKFGVARSCRCFYIFLINNQLLVIINFSCLLQFYIALLSIHSLILVILQFISCVHSEWKECSSYSPPATVILLLFLGFEALLFAIFTTIMLGTQLQAIWNDETVVALIPLINFFQNLY